MMNRINLRKTHRLLYRIYMVKALSALFVGLGILIAPNAVFGSIAYSTITQYIPILLWGWLWIIFGSLIVYGLTSTRYKLARVGLAGLIILYMTLTVGLFTSQFLPGAHVAGSYLFGVGTYAGLSAATFILLLEPPINPETAIQNKRKIET